MSNYKQPTIYPYVHLRIRYCQQISVSHSLTLFFFFLVIKNSVRGILYDNNDLEDCAGSQR